MEVEASSSVETVVSSAETIPYCEESAMWERAPSSCASTISLESDVGELFTHHYIPDRPPAPFSEELVLDTDPNYDVEQNVFASDQNDGDRSDAKAAKKVECGPKN